MFTLFLLWITRPSNTATRIWRFLHRVAHRVSFIFPSPTRHAPASSSIRLHFSICPTIYLLSTACPPPLPPFFVRVPNRHVFPTLAGLIDRRKRRGRNGARGFNPAPRLHAALIPERTEPELNARQNDRSASTSFVSFNYFHPCNGTQSGVNWRFATKRKRFAVFLHLLNASWISRDDSSALCFLNRDGEEWDDHVLSINRPGFSEMSKGLLVRISGCRISLCLCVIVQYVSI